MEEVQKNEPGRQPEKEKKPKRELSPKEVQRRRKMIVFPLMFLAFAGCMYLIFAPSGKEKTESVGGFNADIPLPAEDGIIADKQTAYEQAMMSRKRQDRIQSLQDFGFIGDDETEEPQAEVGLMPEEDPKPVRGGGASSSATAYRDINRQLSTFYETPPEDREKEDLKRQVAELTEKLERQREATSTADEQMALLEKSYELAAKYAGGDIVIPKNTLVAGTAKVQGERLDILVSLIEYAGNIIPVKLAVFDTDEQKGLSVPSSMEQEAFNEAMANIGSWLGTSISFTQNAGQQVAMDVTRGLMQGASGYFAKKFRTVKVKLKAGYRVMLYAKQQ